jgi:hypothetical protein
MTADPSRVAQPVDVDSDTLRNAIRDEYTDVAKHPGKGFHFHTGRRLSTIVGYKEEWFTGVSELAIESFAGTGNPFAMGELAVGERGEEEDRPVDRLNRRCSAGSRARSDGRRCRLHRV